MSVAKGNLLAPALLHLQTRLGVQAVDTFVIDDLSGLAQLQIDHAGAIASMSLGQGDDLVLEHAVAVLSWLIAVGTGAHVDDA